MTYDAVETSAYDGQAIELYKFLGTGGPDYFLTSYATNYTYEFQEYTALAGLTRGTIKKTSSGGSQTGDLEIKLPFDHPMVRAYAFADVPPNLYAEILRGHISDPDEAFRVIWRGNVTTWNVEKREAKLRVPSAFTLVLQNTIPSRRWQGPCNHLLYDAQCGVNRALHDENSNILTFNGNQVTLTALSWASDEGNGGEIVNNRTGERRTIISHSGNSLTLKLPFYSLLVGDPITVFEGCDHTAQTCANKFNNLDKFGGFNLVPGLNPFTQSQLR